MRINKWRNLAEILKNPASKYHLEIREPFKAITKKPLLLEYVELSCSICRRTLLRFSAGW